MAEFRNSIDKSIGVSSVPADTTQGAGAEAFGSLFSNLTNIASQGHRLAQREEVKSQIEQQVRDFAAQPDRLNVLQETQQQLAEQQAARPEIQNNKTMQRLQSDMKRLRKAIDTGAASSTEVRMRANQIVRSAISDVPELAGDFKQVANETLGLYNPELSVIDKQLGIGQEDQQSSAEQLWELQKKNVVNKLNKEYGIVLSDLSDSNVMRVGSQVFKLEGKANTLDTIAQIRTKRDTIDESVAQDYSQSWIQNQFLKSRGQLEQILDSDMTDVEKISAIDDAVAQLQTDARSHRVIGNLSPETLDSLVQPAVDRLQEAKKVVNGDIELAALKNDWNSMLYQDVIDSASRNAGVLSTAVATKFSGPIVGQLVSQQVPGGISGQVETLIDSSVRLISDDRKIPNGDIDTMERMGVFKRYFDTISNYEDVGANQEDARKAATQIVRNLVPEDGADLTEMQLEKWHKALPILARIDIKDVFNKTGVTQQQVERLNNRVQQYIDTQLVPNLRSRLEEDTFVTRKGDLRPGPRATFGREGATGEGPRVRRVVDVVSPTWTDDGRMRLNVDRSRLPAEVRDNPDRMRQFRQKMDRLNSTYVPIWNNAMLTSANMSLSDPKDISQREWEDQFGTLTEDEQEESGDNE